MQAEVLAINDRIGLFAAQTETGKFIVFKLQGESVVQIGDIIAGNLESLGQIRLQNVIKKQDFDANIQNLCETENDVRQLLELTG